MSFVMVALARTPDSPLKVMDICFVKKYKQLPLSTEFLGLALKDPDVTPALYVHWAWRPSDCQHCHNQSNSGFISSLLGLWEIYETRHGLAYRWAGRPQKSANIVSWPPK